MKRINSMSLITIILRGIVLCAVLFVSCSKDEDSVGSSAESLCGIIKASYNDISIQYPDASCTNTGFKPVLNEYGQMISLDFSFSCGSTKYSGKVTTIVYESDGSVRSYDAIINGQNCHWEK
jgi:hypothetical protein